MASTASGRVVASAPLRRSLLLNGALLGGGALLLGGALILLALAELLILGVIGLLLGGGLAVAGGWGLWRGGRQLERAGAGPLVGSEPLHPALPEDVRQHMMQIQMQADQVRDIALRIGRAAAQHNHDAAAQATAVQQVAAATGELDQLVTQVTSTAQAVARAADQVLAASTHSRTVVDDAVGSLSATEQRVGEIMTAIEALRERATQINAINDVLSEIADHTRLLALNATIEAAGAGVEGRRFEVVAAEIRTLAARAHDQGQQVGHLVAELERALAATVRVATAGLQQAERTGQLTGTLLTTATQLTGTAEQMQQIAFTIERAMAQQQTSTAAVAGALTHVAGSADGMRAQTANIATEADDLIDVARQLREVALRFGVSVPRRGRLRLQIAGRETVSSRSLAWQALIDAWNAEHPDAAIALEFVPPAADYLPGLARALTDGTAADLVQVVRGADLGRQGLLAPLDDLLSPTVWDDFYPGLLPADVAGGRLYSLPTEAQPQVILYNRALFATLGLAVPRTWDELIAAAQRCRSDNRWGLILETTPGEFRAKQWLPFIWQGGGDVPDATGQVALGTSAVQAALRLWRDLLVTHRVVPLKRAHPWYDIANLVEGHCAMQYIGSWGVNMLRERYPDFPYGIMPLPLPPGGQPSCLLLTWRLAVNAHSPHCETARAFVRWALAAEGEAGAARVRSLMVEGLPVRRSVVPLVEREGAADPAWRTLLTEIYPHCRVEGPGWDAAAPVLDAALEAALQEAPILASPAAV